MRILPLIALFACAGESPTDPSTPPVRDPDTSESCDLADLDLQWPLPGVDGVNWVVNNYIDLDGGPDILDYMGGNKSYDGHLGIDIDVPSFREMDADFPIIAAADGLVVDLEADQFDRNVGCTGLWNFVQIKYDNGFKAYYGHLKQDSVLVDRGDRVVAGQELGVVGSSGCSTQAHLHYELHDCNGDVVSPFVEDLWVDPPVYDTPLSVMDGIVLDRDLDLYDLKDPGENITEVEAGHTVGIGSSLAGGGPPDTFTLQLRNPSGEVHDGWTVQMEEEYRHHMWYTNRRVTTELGTWTAEILINEEIGWSLDFEVY